MDLELIPATDESRLYLFNLRKLTMTEHLEKDGLYLSDDEHKLRVDEVYESSHIIFLSDEKVGVIKYQEFDKKILIMQIQIHPDFQGRGLGKRVIKQIIDSAKPKPVELSVLKSNPAKKLYERLGFKVIREDEYEFYMEFKH